MTSSIAVRVRLTASLFGAMEEVIIVMDIEGRFPSKNEFVEFVEFQIPNSTGIARKSREEP